MALSDTENELLDLLGELARVNEICPNKYRLARQIGTTPFLAQFALERLREEGLIDWTIHRKGRGLGKVRVVTVRATGESTRLPQTGKCVCRSRDDVLEQAKTVLRRKGCIVFAAEVTDGDGGRGLTRVDHRRLQRDAVLALAAKVTF